MVLITHRHMASKMKEGWSSPLSLPPAIMACSMAKFNFTFTFYGIWISITILNGSCTEPHESTHILTSWSFFTEHKVFLYLVRPSEHKQDCSIHVRCHCSFVHPLFFFIWLPLWYQVEVQIVKLFVTYISQSSCYFFSLKSNTMF
jgi:hypothetical protein